MIRRENEGCCKATLSDSDNFSQLLNISQSAGFNKDPDSREIIEIDAEGAGKRSANGSFFGIGEPKAPGMSCSFYEVSRRFI